MLLKLSPTVLTQPWFIALLALCEGNPPVTSGFPSQVADTVGFDIFFDASLIKRLNKPLTSSDLRRNDTHYSVIVIRVPW